MEILSVNNNGISNNNNSTFMLENIQQAYWVGQNSALELSIPARYYVEIEVPAYVKNGLQKALNKLVQRHEMLRAVILPSGEQHILHQVSEYQIKHWDLRGLSASDCTERMDELRRSISGKNLSCDIWPQFDIHSTQSDDKFRLHLSFALWMLDGWSFHIFLRELLELSDDPQAELPAIDMSFSDYIRSIAQIRQSPRRQKAWEYWKARIEDFPAPPALPLKRQTSDHLQPDFNHISTKMAAKEWKQIMACCAKVGITPNILACAVYADILRQYTGSQRFSISLLYSGRIQHLPQASSVLGNFGTTILLEIDFKDDQTLLEKARSLQLQFWNDVDHASVSGIEVSRAIQQRTGTGPNIAVPVTFTTVSPPPVSADSKHIPFEIDHDSAQLEVPQVYLDHQVHFSHNGDAVFNWDYVKQIFPSGFIRLIADAHLERMSRLANDTTCWNIQDTTLNLAQLPPPVSTHAKGLERLEISFDRKAKQSPDAIAVIDGDIHISYGELSGYARAIASLLGIRNLKSGQLVGVSMKKGWEQIAAVLGILYAGAAYVPIDPDLPEERRNLLFTNSEARLILTQSALNMSMTCP